MRKPKMWFPNRSITKQAVQLQKQVEALNFGFNKGVAKTKV